MPRDLTDAEVETKLEPWRLDLMAAAAIVRERWQQHAPGYAGSPRCAYGAIEEVTGLAYGLASLPLPALAYCEASKRLSEYLASVVPQYSARTRIVHWNDERGQTAGNVASTMERVAGIGAMLGGR
jgi:hypothetical protein